jgi:hypothetical protein
VKHLGRAKENLHLQVIVHNQPRLKEQSGSLNTTALRQLSGLTHLFLLYNAKDVKTFFPDIASFVLAMKNNTGTRRNQLLA